MLEEKIIRYTLRVPKDLIDKLGYIADYKCRTKNKELEQMIKARINAFEQKFGEITTEQIENTKKKKEI